MSAGRCRFCDSQLQYTFADLGMSPLANSFLKSADLNKKEMFYPLHAYVCSGCLLVQLEEFESPENIFSDYAYFSSYSETWLRHAREYAEMVTKRFSLTSSSHVIEIASNDGYLLQYFSQQGIPVLGIEPAANVAAVALKAGIPTMTEFFGADSARRLAVQGNKADLLIGNNVLAHVPDLNDFVRGMKLLLKDRGIITMEFPHLLQLMRNNQFDTIYHEHFSYFSFSVAEKLFHCHELVIFDVEQLPTHGGSLRIYCRHAEDDDMTLTGNVMHLRDMEKEAGLDRLDTYSAFAEGIRETKRSLLELLIRIKREGKSIVAYGAPAKGTTLLNYCGIRNDFLDYTVDLNPHKQGCFLPGTHIPVYHPDRIKETQPDYILILPWNIKHEIMAQMSSVRAWGGKFIIPGPRIVIV